MKILTTICGAALLFCGAIYAQNSDRINVRFANPVVVGETTMPAGECEIDVMRSASDSIILVVRSQAGPYASVLANRFTDADSASADHATVVLDHRGDTYKLNRVVLPDHTSYQLVAAE